MLDFECGFEIKQGMVWEMIWWILRGYLLITSIKSILDCHVRKKMRKRKEIEKGIEELTKIVVFESWKALND